MCSDLLGFIEYNKIEKPAVIGHPIGGRCAALFAKQHPELLSKLVIVDISPFDCENQEELSAFHRNILTALATVNLNEIHSRNDAAAQLSEKINDVNLQKFLLKNLYRTQKSGFLWRFYLPALLNNVKNIGCGTFKKNEKTEMKIPTLFIVGEKSNHVVNPDIEMITNVFSDLKTQIISGAGHWIHSEQREKFVACLQKFISKQM
jgi:pimeloyl-ACP methyl ester carboxylesterase